MRSRSKINGCTLSKRTRSKLNDCTHIMGTRSEINDCTHILCTRSRLYSIYPFHISIKLSNLIPTELKYVTKDAFNVCSNTDDEVNLNVNTLNTICLDKEKHSHHVCKH